jgi:hypothetical protein
MLRQIASSLRFVPFENQLARPLYLPGVSTAVNAAPSGASQQNRRMQGISEAGGFL